MNEKKWIRKCPKCSKKKVYTHRGKYNRDLKLNRLCRTCWKIRGKIFNGPFVRDCPECKTLITYNRKDALDRANNHNRLCNSCKFKGERSIWYKTDGPMIGKKQSERCKTKIRLKAIDRIKKLKGCVSPSYNPRACKYFDELNREKRWELIHAENGKEYYIKNLGYWIDGYDKKRNIVVEYDESYHNSPKQRKKDNIRQKQIKKLLKCRFFRYNEDKKFLYEI